MQVSDIQRQISKRNDYGCSEVQFANKFPQNGRLLAQNSPKSAKVARKLRSMAIIARLRENAKVAQKLLSATSQFSGGTTYVNIRFILKFERSHLERGRFMRLGWVRTGSATNGLACSGFQTKLLGSLLS